jgi:hypothetical protein
MPEHPPEDHLRRDARLRHSQSHRLLHRLPLSHSVAISGDPWEDDVRLSPTSGPGLPAGRAARKVLTSAQISIGTRRPARAGSAIDEMPGLGRLRLGLRKPPGKALGRQARVHLRRRGDAVPELQPCGRADGTEAARGFQDAGGQKGLAPLIPDKERTETSRSSMTRYFLSSAERPGGGSPKNSEVSDRGATN